MFKLFCNFAKTTPLLLASVLLLNGVVVNQAQANETLDNTNTMLGEIENYNNQTTSEGQVTSVSQLRDVSPTDWSYEALRSLVERYGCIVGYPDRTYRGNRALSRYEFAAGLNACMQQMERLIASSEAVLREDIDKLKRLMKEFEAELAALGAKVDNLEGRVAFLEDHQFSTTTKLKGEAILSLQAFGGGDNDNLDSFDVENHNDQVTLSDRVRLTLDTSFTGKDLLRTRLAAGNTPNLRDSYPLTGGNQARLNYDFDNDNNVVIDKLYYTSPVGDNFKFWVGTDLAAEDIYQTFSPFTESSGTGSLSRALRYNPVIYRTSDGAGAAVKYKFNDTIDLTASYLAANANDPTQGNGLFNGEYAAGAQLGVHLADTFDLGLAYMFNYGGSIAGGLAGRDLVGTLQDTDANYLLDPITTNNIGLQTNWRISKNFNWSAWGGWTDANVDGYDQANDVDFDASADYWTFSTNFSFIDLGKEGAVLTIGGGMLPDTSTIDSSYEDIDIDDSTAWIVEGNYKFPINDNISITPGVYAVFNPGNTADNDTIVVGVLRTVFKF